jgi:hypothetical protein
MLAIAIVEIIKRALNRELFVFSLLAIVSNY